MCGKFTQMYSWRQVHDFTQILGAKQDDEELTYTPMRAVPVVHLGRNLHGQGDRMVSPMVWGFTDRAATGFRRPRHMHARGETVHRLPTFADAFHARRGVTFVQTFNEGHEIPTTYLDGGPTGKTWTQQWKLRRRDGRPAIIGVVFDEFDAGKDLARGLEREFVQVTVPANALVSTITDRMPLMLEEDEIPLWLGEWRASEDEIRALIRTREFDPAIWDMQVEDPTKKPPRPRRKAA